MHGGPTRYGRSLASDPATFEVKSANIIEPDLSEFVPSIYEATVSDVALARPVFCHKSFSTRASKR